MAARGINITIEYMAWDVIANAGKAGDVDNHSLRVITDGISSAVTNDAEEIDSVNSPGIYKINLTDSEMDGKYITLAGLSSTENVIILPVPISTDVSGSDCTDDGISFTTRRTPIPYLGDPDYPEPPY